MIHIIESFACGLAFAMGVTSFFFIRDMATAKGRAELNGKLCEPQGGKDSNGE